MKNKNAIQKSIRNLLLVKYECTNKEYEVKRNFSFDTKSGVISPIEYK